MQREEPKSVNLEPTESPARTTPAETEPDDALILWMLSLTPTQRLEVLQGFVDSVRALRDGEQAGREKDRAVLPVLRRTLERRREQA